MSQVITPPTAGAQEEASKDWYRAEALRKLSNELHSIMDGMSYSHAAHVHLSRATQSLAKARKILSPQQRG